MDFTAQRPYVVHIIRIFKVCLAFSYFYFKDLSTSDGIDGTKKTAREQAHKQKQPKVKLGGIELYRAVQLESPTVGVLESIAMAPRSTIT